MPRAHAHANANYRAFELGLHYKYFIYDAVCDAHLLGLLMSLCYKQIKYVYNC